MSDDDDYMNDKYVADLLDKETRTGSMNFSAIGLRRSEALRKPNAPKPNTRFLQNVLRSTDAHNSALLAKEQRDARDRQRELYRKKRHGDADRDRPSKRDERRRRDDYDGHRERDSHHRSLRRSRSPRGRSRRRSRDSRRHGHRSVSSDRRDNKSRHHRRHHRSRSRSPHSELHRDKHEHIKRKRRRSRSRSSESDHHHRHDRSRSRDRGQRRRRNDASSADDREQLSKRARDSSSRSNQPPQTIRRASSASNSSEGSVGSLLGPAPPDMPSKITVKGRGAYKSNDMDSRFEASYEPSADLAINSDEEDEWGLALEAAQDRQRWQLQGAERLKQAGFTDEQIARWKKGDKKDETDVRWAKKGEGREWDRGKVFDSTGEVQLKPNWGRLKDA